MKFLREVLGAVEETTADRPVRMRAVVTTPSRRSFAAGRSPAEAVAGFRGQGDRRPEASGVPRTSLRSPGRTKSPQPRRSCSWMACT